jgi:hypothetical protein
VPWQDELGVSHMAIGDVLTQQSSFAGALASYRKAMSILETFSTARKGLELDPSLVLISPVPYEKHHQAGRSLFTTDGSRSSLTSVISNSSTVSCHGFREALTATSAITSSRFSRTCLR